LRRIPENDDLSDYFVLYKRMIKKQQIDFYGYLDELYKFREKRSKELADLTPGERCERINERGRELAAKYGLKMAKPKKTAKT